MKFSVLFKYLINPRIEKTESLGLKRSILALAYSVLWYYLFLLGSSIFIIPLFFLNLWPEQPTGIGESSVLDAVILVPLIEELIFRLPLKCFFRNIFISLAIAFFVFTNKYFGYYISTGFSFFLIAIPFIIRNYKDVELRTNEFFEIHYRYFFYASVLFFGFVHITNFDNLELKNYLISPFIISFQLFMGFILGYLRVKFKHGIVLSYLAHSLINLPLVLL